MYSNYLQLFTDIESNFRFQNINMRTILNFSVTLRYYDIDFQSILLGKHEVHSV